MHLIEQSADGTLLLGEMGEQLVGQHDFYAVFQIPEEYRVVYEGNELGTLPVVTPLVPETSIIFAGRRWRVIEVNHERAMVIVAPSRTGSPPLFGGEAGELADVIVDEMRGIYEDDATPVFLDGPAQALLAQARQSYRELGLMRMKSIEIDGDTFLFPWAGTLAANTLVLALRNTGLPAFLRRTVIEIERTGIEGVRSALVKLATRQPPSPAQLANTMNKLARKKYDRFLTRDLLIEGLSGDYFDVLMVPILADRILTERPAQEK